MPGFFFALSDTKEYTNLFVRHTYGWMSVEVQSRPSSNGMHLYQSTQREWRPPTDILSFPPHQAVHRRYVRTARLGLCAHPRMFVERERDSCAYLHTW